MNTENTSKFQNTLENPRKKKSRKTFKNTIFSARKYESLKNFQPPKNPHVSTPNLINPITSLLLLQKKKKNVRNPKHQLQSSTVVKQKKKRKTQIFVLTVRFAALRNSNVPHLYNA